tara:strand:- start:1706 stop:1852 length:147 start_codon:yes stop_codon:yes gene_type:complete
VKIKLEVEIDTDNQDDLNTIEDLVEMLKGLAEHTFSPNKLKKKVTDRE